MIGTGVPRLIETQLDIRVLAVAAAISIGTALVFGIGPALALVVTNVQEVLKEGGRTVSASRRVMIAGCAMVAVQVALTIVLLAGAGLMFKSIWQMTTYPAGFVPDQILTMRLDIRGPQYRDQQARHDFAAALISQAQVMPGVRDAATTTGRGTMMLVIKEGEGVPPPGERERRGAPVSSISAGFGPLLGMSLVSGRGVLQISSDANDRRETILAEPRHSAVEVQAKLFSLVRIQFATRSGPSPPCCRHHFSPWRSA